MKYDMIITGIIGWSWNCTAQYVRSSLAAMPGREVNVLIASPGGYTNDALQIYRAFRDHGDIHVYINGETASAATIIAMGAKTITMSRYALMLLHKCSATISVYDDYNSDELDTLIQSLCKQKRSQDTTDAVMANIYADRCHKPVAEIQSMMFTADWLTTDQCLEHGLIDDVYDDERPVIDDRVISDLKSFGYPDLPQSYLDAASPSRSLIQRLVAMVSPSHFSASHSYDDNNKNNCMKKVFSLLCAILSVQDIAFDDSHNAAISESQLDSIEAALSQRDSQIAELQASVKQSTDQISAAETRYNELKAQFDALNQSPGDVTAPVDPAATDTHDSVNTIFKSARSMYDNIKNIL
jgi:ATP-dependent protease ClpP protease subunit